MRNRIARTVFLLATLCLPASSVQSGPKYDIIDLGELIGGTGSQANALNNRGEVVGRYHDGSYDRAFLWSGGIMSELPGYSGLNNTADDINDSGSIVGTSQTSGVSVYAVLWSNGIVSAIGGDVSWAKAINDRGDIIGQTYVRSDPFNTTSAFFKPAGGAMMPLGPVGRTSCEVKDINNSGLVVGFCPSDEHAFVYDGTSFIYLGKPGGSNWSIALAVNDFGDIAGTANFPHPTNVYGTSRAVLYKNDVWTDISGGAPSMCIAMNNKGDIVGTIGSPPQTAVVWKNLQMQTLNSLIEPTSGWSTLTIPTDINDSGQIVGVGIRNGQGHAFLMSPKKKTFQLVDYHADPLANIAVTVSKISGDFPTFTETAIGEFMTNSRGELTFTSLDIAPGDSIKINLILHTEPADKHIALLGTKYTLYLDNMLIDDFGIVTWPEVDTESAQEIVMNHTTVAWNIVASIEWDARVDYLTTLQASFRHMANYLYDVTDAQSRIDTVVILDNGQGWDQADFRIHASNMVHPNASGVPATDDLNGCVYMPRKWYGNTDAGRAWSVIDDPLDVSDGYTFTTLAHEYGHFAFGFYDEYQFLHNGSYSVDSGRCSIIDNYGFMDGPYPYPTASVYQSEMSNESRYAFPSCWNNWHFQKRGMSCWEWFEQDFEGYYTGVPLFAPIKMPSERLLPSGFNHLVGPNNDLVNLDYDVGSLVRFRVDLTPPTRKIKFVNLANSTTGAPLANVNVVARIANSGISLNQGNTSDAGEIRMLGMSVTLPDTITASGRSYVAPARSRSSQSGWVSVMAAVPDIDSMEILATPMAGNHQFVTVPEFAGSDLQYRLLTATSLVAAPSLIGPGGDTLPFATLVGEYLATATGSLPSDGSLTISALDDSNATFFVPTAYRIHVGAGTGGRFMGPAGVCEALLDTGAASVGRVMLLTSDFPVIQTGLELNARQAGPATSLVIENLGQLGGANGVLIRYDDSDLAGGYIDQETTLRIWRFDLLARTWELIGGAVDTSHNEVAAPIAATGVYAAFTSNIPVDVKDDERGESLPENFELQQNYPNPFNPSTTIRYSIPTRTHVTIEIFNLLGQHVRTVVDGMMSAGRHQAIWDGRSADGQLVSSGLYLYRMSTEQVVLNRKMLLLK